MILKIWIVAQNTSWAGTKSSPLGSINFQENVNLSTVYTEGLYFKIFIQEMV